MTQTHLTAEALQALVDPSPLCTFLNSKVVETGPDGVRLDVTLPPQTVGHADLGSVHGGIVAAMIDIACTCANNAVTGRRDTTTVDIRVDFHRPGLGNRFVLYGRVVDRGPSVTVTEGEIRNPEGKLIASGRALV